MGKSNKLIIISLVLLVLGAGVYFGYPYLKAKQAVRKQEDLATRMTTFKIMDTTIDQGTLDLYREEFDKRKAFFLQHQGDLISFDVLLKMGLLKQLVHDYSGAEEIWVYLYKLEPNSYVLNSNLANLYQYYLTDYQKAEGFYLKALEPKDVVMKYSIFANFYELYRYRLEDADKTKAVLDRAMSELPDDINAFLMAADYYRETGDKDKARELYNQALKINPASIVARAGLEKLNKLK